MGGYEGLQRPGEGQTPVNLLTEEWAFKEALETTGIPISLIFPIFVLMKRLDRFAAHANSENVPDDLSLGRDHPCPSGWCAK
jgi:hypothetical protein